eukprot:13147404-Alexandrium_andersonii.AAC.1
MGISPDHIHMSERAAKARKADSAGSLEQQSCSTSALLAVLCYAACMSAREADRARGAAVLAD